MNDVNSVLNYYKDELKWNPPFAEVLSKYSPEGLKGYLTMRESIQQGHLPKKTRELIFTILDSLDDEVSGAKAHAVAAIEAGLTMEELVEAFVIVTIVKGINVLCKTGVEAIKAAEKRLEEIKGEECCDEKGRDS
ncbi:MAG: carboxymuconolactone decarboxylase family protein [Clostridium sp.]|uniref:carboxymuconolactone decarboxylase family protein n=1 Tax=Clostridium sp. TaxID=1506 RepID=UPI003052382A